MRIEILKTVLMKQNSASSHCRIKFQKKNKKYKVKIRGEEGRKVLRGCGSGLWDFGLRVYGLGVWQEFKKTQDRKNYSNKVIKY